MEGKMKLIFKRLTIVITLFFIFGCSLGYQSPDYVQLAHKITKETAKKLKEEKNLYLIGTGGGMMGDIKMMAMSFNYYQEVNLESARKLLVYAIDEYLSAINSNEKVRPYLHNYPFRVNNIEIMIFIYNPDRSKPALEKINFIQSINGILEYYISSDFDNPILEETYNQAVEAITLKNKNSDFSFCDYSRRNKFSVLYLQK